MICPQEFLDLTYHNNVDRQCLSPCTHSHTQAFIPLDTSSHHDLISTKTYVSGLNAVYNVRNLRFNVAPHHHLANLKHLMPDLPVYTSTLLAPFHLLEDMLIYWLVLTDSNNIISNSQWNSRMISSPTKVIYQGISQSHHVDRFTSTEFARYLYHTKRRFTLYYCRASVWYNTTITWWIIWWQYK